MNETRDPSSEPKVDTASERFQQAMVDADIEGLPRSPEIEAMISEWDKAGVDHEEQIRRLKFYFERKQANTTAAE